MSNRDYRLLDRASTTALRQAKRRGIQITLQTVTDSGGASIGLWAFLDADQQTTNLRGGMTDDFRITFIVPRKQTNFPSTLSPGAKITYAGVDYQIDEVRPDAEDLAHCATVALICGRFGFTVEL